MSLKYVKIYYGPCDSFHTVGHKPQKLKGLRDRLQKLGFRVDFVPVDYMNYCVMEMCGHEVFRCNIKNLNFNTPYYNDIVCQRAVEAIVDASAKFSRARTYLWSWTLIDDQMFKRTEYAPKEYWPFDIDIKPFNLDCINCCGILVTKEKNTTTVEEKDLKD